MTSINLVREFNEVFGVLIAFKPEMPTIDRVDFRVNFIKEEAEETKKAWIEDDLVEFADGLGDIQYVLDGFFLEAGLADKKDAIMAEIHRSNMSKACRSLDEAKETQRVRQLEFPNEIILYKARYDYYIVYREADNKVLKSINYSKPNLEPIIYDKIS